MSEQTDRTARLQAGLEEIRMAGQGLFQVDVFDHDRFDAVFAAASVGDEKAKGLMATFRMFFAKVEVAQRGDRPFQCLLCPSELGEDHPMAAMVTVGPSVPDNRRLFVSGLCATCYQQAGLRAAICKVYSKAGSMPGLRVIDIGTGGRA